MTQTVVITGANRGIGLELARIWHQRGDKVIAVCRRSSDELDALDISVIRGIDISRAADIDSLRDALQDITIDTLFNNAGILANETLQAMDFDGILRQFEVNTLGSLRVTHALMDRIAPGGKVGLMSSQMGSIADNQSGGYYGYRISKAGLNAAGKCLAVDLRTRNIAVLLLHPGYVQTGMTGYHGTLTPEQAAAGLVQRMDKLTLENSGQFLHSDGRALPW